MASPDSTPPNSGAPADAAADAAPKHTTTALLNSWTLERLLGSGSQGQVWRARNTSDVKSTAAVKLLRNCTDARHEIAAYERLCLYEAHPNVLDARFILTDRWSINIGFEICTTDMLEYVLKSGKLTEDESRHWVRQLAGAVGHLHACDIVHLDVKLENTFIDASMQLKLGDLGLAALVGPSGCLHKTCGSGVYAAPEVLLSNTYGVYDGRAADVWSVGVCAFVMARGRFPFHVRHQTNGYTAYEDALRRAHEEGAPPQPPPRVLASAAQRETLSTELLTMLDQCIHYEPSHRPTIGELLTTEAWLNPSARDVRRDAATPEACEGACVLADSRQDSDCAVDVSPRSVPTNRWPPSPLGHDAQHNSTPPSSPTITPRVSRVTRRSGSGGASSTARAQPTPPKLCTVNATTDGCKRPRATTPASGAAKRPKGVV